MKVDLNFCEIAPIQELIPHLSASCLFSHVPAVSLCPNGERWKNPNGDTLDFHKGQPGKPGWRGRDHWHWKGGKDHLKPGDEVPADTCEEPKPEPNPAPNEMSLMLEEQTKNLHLYLRFRLSNCPLVHRHIGSS